METSVQEQSASQEKRVASTHVGVHDGAAISGAAHEFIGDPARPNRAGILALQRQIGNHAVRRYLQSRHQNNDTSTIHRWTPLGTEYYVSQGHTPEGVGVIAGVPEPEEAQYVTKQTPVGMADEESQGQLRGESEWRRLLGRGSSAIKVYSFLRAALLNDSEWEAHVRQYSGGNPGIEELHAEGLNIGTASRQVTRPSEEEQMALAKAIYLRGRARIGFDFDRYPGLSELMDRFMARFQPRLLESMAEHNVPFGAENVEPAARASSPAQQASMIGSAAGTLTKAAGTFAAWDVVKRATEPRSSEERDAEEKKMLALREAEMAGQILRGVADEAAEMRREEIEMLKNIIGIAMAAIPIPGVGQFITRTALRMSEGALREAVENVLTTAVTTLAADSVKDGLAEAMARGEFSERVQDIRTEVVWIIRRFSLGDEEDDFVNTVNATLMGGGR